MTPTNPAACPLELPGVRTRTARALLVLGSHRSGTSALTRILNLLGADLATDPLPPAPDNETGFWESRALVDLHEEVLAALGVRWNTAGGLSREFFDSPAGRPFRDRLGAIVARDYGHSRLFVAKDPRMCRLLPLWRAALDRMRIEPACVLILRKPWEVAASLVARDGMPVGRGLLIWLWHVLEAEADSRGLARTVVTYDDLLLDWRGTVERAEAELGITWPTSPQQAAPLVEDFLSIDLRHHRVPDGAPPAGHLLASVVERVYAALGAGDRRDSIDEATLDSVREQLSVAHEIHSHLRAEPAGHGEAPPIGRLESRLDDLRRESQALAARVVEAENRLDRAAREEESLRARLRAERERHEAAQRVLLEELRARPGWIARTRNAALLRLRMSTARIDLPDQATRRAVRESGLFDALFYRAQSPAQAWSGHDPFTHFLYWGGFEGRDPNRLFDSAYYLAAWPDVRQAGLNPLLHYWRFGAHEGRDPHPLFDTSFYAEQVPELRESGENPLAHYLRLGAYEGRRAHPQRDAESRARLSL